MPHTDDFETKVGPTYDSIRAQLLINNQQRTWDMIQHVSTVEMASLAAWFYLYDKKEFLISSMLMLFSIVIISCLLLSIFRYTYLMRDASASLNGPNGQSIYLSSNIASSCTCIPTAGKISKTIPIIIIIFNFIILCVSLVKLFGCSF